MSLKIYIILLTIVCTSTLRAQVLDFSENCGDGDNYTLSFVGDLVMHSPLQRKASRHKDFKSLWQDVIPYFELADFSYLNLETPLADGVGLNNRPVRDPGHVYDKDVYTTYPRFNAHYSLARDLIDSGIDVVSTANNHSLDRGALGVDRTIDNLNDAGLNFSGTQKKGQVNNQRWFTVTDIQGLSVAWISCTEMTNGIPDRHNQVLQCFKHAQLIEDMIKSLSDKVDVIVLLPHWGHEKHHNPSRQQKKAGRQWLEYGATMVIGSHPHVLQPMEKYTTADGRQGFIMYSLGNFTTFHYDLEQKSTVVLYVNLEKSGRNKVKINGVKYLPLFMRNRTGNLMDVEVYPNLPTSQFVGTGFAKVDDSLEHVFSIIGDTNVLLEDPSEDIDFTHCSRRLH